MIKLLTVFLLGAIELWAAIPAGLALKLHPLATGATAVVGALFGAVVVVLLGERVRAWLVRLRGGKEENTRCGRIYRIWQRYGVAGLGLSAPLLTGVPLGVALGLMLGAPTDRLLFWISLGIVLWGIGLTLVGALGLAGVEAVRHRSM